MLAALGGHFGWPRAELDSLTAADALWWLRALSDLRRAEEAAK